MINPSEDVIKSYLQSKDNNMGTKTDLQKYKENLSKSIIDYMESYDLCSEGVRDFCRENDIPIKAEREVTITVTFTIEDGLNESEVEDCVDDFCRTITEAHFMRQYMDYKIDDENYRVDIKGS